MLLALSIRNFKSIRAARIRFGPLTCCIGGNGAGKSNLFDAIHFLSALADVNIKTAAARVLRGTRDRSPLLDLVFERDPDREIQLSADITTPRSVLDDYEQATEPSTTLLTYTVRLRYIPESGSFGVRHESLTHAKPKSANDFIGFRCSRDFKKSVASGRRLGGPFISTSGEKIRIRGDAGSQPRATGVGRSPFTAVHAAKGPAAADYPTVLAAKREMASWRTVHLEPSALRTPDNYFVRPPVITRAGRRLPATLRSIIERGEEAQTRLLDRIRRINDHITGLKVEDDEAEGRHVLQVQMQGLGWLPGDTLSDTTLRWIAFAATAADVKDRAVLCIEEPETGFHPSRMSDLAQLLRDYAVNAAAAAGEDNPLRQVVVNSQSPELVRQFPPDELIVAEQERTSGDTPETVFRPTAGSWRATTVNEEPSTGLPADLQAAADFIGGRP